MSITDGFGIEVLMVFMLVLFLVSALFNFLVARVITLNYVTYLLSIFLRHC